MERREPKQVGEIIREVINKLKTLNDGEPQFLSGSGMDA